MSNDKVFIGLGGNLGNPANTFSAALKELESRNCRVLRALLSIELSHMAFRTNLTS